MSVSGLKAHPECERHRMTLEAGRTGKEKERDCSTGMLVASCPS